MSVAAPLPIRPFRAEPTLLAPFVVAPDGPPWPNVGKHNDTWTVPGYYSNIAKFVKATAAGGAHDTAAAAAAGKDETEAEDDDGWERLDRDVPAADMSVSELRGKLRKRKVAHEHCVEKAELVSLLEGSAKTD